MIAYNQQETLADKLSWACSNSLAVAAHRLLIYEYERIERTWWVLHSSTEQGLKNSSVQDLCPLGKKKIKQRLNELRSLHTSPLEDVAGMGIKYHCKLLLKNGAPLTYRCWASAIRGGHIEVVKLFAKKGNITHERSV